MSLGRKQRIILAALASGSWVRGPDLAEAVGIPAYVLWPYIERLRWRGYEIDGDPGGSHSRGYRLRRSQRLAA